MADYDERAEELGALEAIYPELKADHDHFSATLELPVSPSTPLLVRFISSSLNGASSEIYAQGTINDNAYIERDVELSHLPPLTLQVTLPEDYPTSSPPKVHLGAATDWLPKEKLYELEGEARKLWEEYGHCQILFTYLDHLQQAAERGFDLDHSADGCLVLPMAAEKILVDFDQETMRVIFNAGHYDCGICLEPKKGSSCYKMKRCDHVFCLQCLRDFYINAVTEGDVAVIRCLHPTCGKQQTATDSQRRKRKSERTLHPHELLAMGIDDPIVRRYVEMKRKKKLEADKNTVYCPRTWCQGSARSSKYPPIPADLASYTADDFSSSESETDSIPSKHDSPRKPTSSETNKTNPPDPADRLAVCEKCSLAFCRVCYMGWHGSFARCYPRDPNELSVEEKASYDYIRLHTSPCPTCSSPTQKTMGCNHMKCFQCNTHFCYLCGAWLDVQNPYVHFNKVGSPCFQRLWELEEGDEGQGPEDGRGFAGGRGWEQLAIDAAREADEAEAAAGAEGVGRDAHVEDGWVAEAEAREPDAVAAAMAQVHLHDPVAPPRNQPRAAQQRAQRPRNPFPARPPAQGQAQAVRNHERANRRANGRANGAGNDARICRRPAAVENEDERQHAELQRFLDMARQDEEDRWDSDELDDDDGRFEIR